MNRQKILVAACVLASASIGGNVWLLTRKKEPAADQTAQAKEEGPKLPTFDFKGTAFEDGSWKLTDGAPETEVPRVGPADPKTPAPGQGQEPVFGGTALDDGAWKLGGDKDGSKKADSDKDKASAKESDKSLTPPDAAAPGTKAAQARPVIERFDFSDTAFADNSWRLSDTAEETEENAFPLTSPDTRFVFGDYQVPRDPATMEERAGNYGKTPPVVMYSPTEDSRLYLKGDLNAQGARLYVSREFFERSLPPGLPSNLRGFAAREDALHSLQ